MKILMVASEVAPYSKTGGLGDVMSALPQAVAELGHDVAVVTPAYRHTKVRASTPVFESLTVRVGKATHFPRVVSAKGRVKMYFVDYPPFFDRDGLYGDSRGDFGDNAERFFLFSRVALEIAKLHFRPDILHCHEWQSGMAPVLLRTLYAKDAAVRDVPVLFTIHNLGYQGLFESSVLGELGLPGDLFTSERLEFYGKVSFLKGALVFADALSTVSKRYAQEIQTEQYGCGLEGVLQRRADALYGILNGADYEHWNPATDPRIAARYSSRDLSGKALCKKDLLACYRLARDGARRPLIGMVARLAWQKGVELIAEAASELMSQDCSLVVLGAGDPSSIELLKDMQARCPERVGFRAAFDEDLAHKVEAGADIFLMPSRYEPCGLNQLYSLKYGTVPVVRATGGLDDTVEPYNPATGQGTGFKFKEYSAQAMMASLQQAFAVYRDRAAWEKLMRNGMAKDYSWNSSAAEYVRLYERVREK